MKFENWITQISDNLPNFTVRVFILTFILLWIIVSIILYILSKKDFKNKVLNKIKSFQYLILGLISLIFSVITYLSYTQYLETTFGNNLIYILSPFILLTIFSISKYILKILNKQKIQKGVYIFELTLLSLLFCSFLFISLFTVPHVSITTESNSNILENTEEITLTFTSPLRTSDIHITVTPESNFELHYEYFLGLKGLAESITVIPMESFLPDQKIVIYTTGIQRVFPFGVKHENSQEFFTPREPEIEAVVLGADIQNVNIGQPITIELDSNDLKSLEWKVIFTPEAEFEILRDFDNSLVIQPKRLMQGTLYQLEIVKSVIKYNPKTFEKISTESEEVVSNISFKTTPPPGILSYNRSSGIVSNSEPLILDFEIPLKEESLKDRTSISPSVEGSISLSTDKKQLIFTPTSSFAKNTEYTFTLLSGVENILGGYTETDISITFKTPGYVALLYASPRNGSTNIPITTASISLTFNQPINHSSVQERFSISPSIDGTFSWSGDTLIYKFSSSLSYLTKYTVNIASGVVATYGINSTSTISSSFTTKAETVKLNVPLYYQTESFTCNLAATRMVLAYKGISSSESGIKDSIGIGSDPNSDWVDKYGVHWGPISSYISGRGVSNTLKRGWDLTSALQEVKNGHPILVYIYNGSSLPMGPFTLEGGATGYKGMHSAVIIGYIGKPEAPTTVILNDPWRGQRYLSPNTFRYLWYYTGYLNNTGIVIY